MTASVRATNMNSSSSRWSSYGIVALVLCTVLGALAGYGTSWRAGNPRATVVIAGAIWGAFVGCCVLLRFVQLTVLTKRIYGTCAGMTAAVACGITMQWQIGAIVAVAVVAAVLGALNPEWSKNANI
jgi:hypothetical protein